MSRRAEQPTADVFDRRNREIGAILAAARQRQNRTVTECALAAATTRRRYSAIERGEAVVSAVELEALMRFLNVPASQMWRELCSSNVGQHVVVQAQPGERVQLVVEVFS
jgi:transcriptional regulator with XRE-family HTH domain